MSFLPLITFIGNLNIFPLISTGHIVSINELTLILKIICQWDIKHMTLLDKNNDVSFEGLDISLVFQLVLRIPY
jgi:hypothetical protein